MGFLAAALKPFLKTAEDGRVIQGSLEDVNLGHVLLKYFLEVRKTLYNHSKTENQITVGGVITHILRYCKVRFVEDDKHVDNLINMAYLSGAKILGGAVGDQIIYKMSVGEKEQMRVLLPNPQLTTLMKRENIEFIPPKEALYDPERHAAPDWVSRMKKKGKEPQVEEEEESEEEEGQEGQGSEDDEEIYGAHRYHFTPYDEPIQNAALRRAHEDIKKLQKSNRWRDRTINKLVKAVKVLKGQVKKLTKALSPKKSGEGHSREDEGMAETSVAMELDEEQRRKSYHGESNTALVIREPSRHSSYEAGNRRRRQRKRIRTPSPVSRNPSPSLSSEEDTTSGSHQF